MANASDGKMLQGILQTTFDVSLGAAVKSLQMMRTPEESIGKVVSTVRDLVTIPDDEFAPGLQEKAQVIAGVWLEKGATLLNECKTAGEKLTEGK